eukprot:12850393-Heterocapsa_arctica.AAC.1
MQLSEAVHTGKTMSTNTIGEPMFLRLRPLTAIPDRASFQEVRVQERRLCTAILATLLATMA